VKSSVPQKQGLAEFLRPLKPPFLFVGIGNEFKGDDASGPSLIARLEAQHTHHYTLNCGVIPENYVQPIAAFHAASIILVDAVDMGEQPGTVGLFHSEDIEATGVSTHGMPLSLFADVVKTETGAAVYLLGIQPKAVTLGEPLSPEVEKAVSGLAAVIHNFHHA